MARLLDREVLIGFIQEARGYLPSIRQHIEALSADPGNLEHMEVAHRLTHTIKGASAMVGLAGLSHMAFRLEDTLEELGAEQLALDERSLVFLRRAVDLIEEYLDGVQADRLQERPLVAELARADRRLRGLPPEEDDAAIESLLARVAPAAPAVERQPTASAVEAQPAASAAERQPAALAAEGPAWPDRPQEPDWLALDQGPIWPEPLEEPPLPPESIPDELMQAFALEAEDHLATISAQLAAWDRQPEEKERLQEIRRSIHTLKGAAGAVGLAAVAHLAHRTEDLLDQLYAGTLVATPDLVELLADSTDMLEDLIADRADAGQLDDLYARYHTWLALPTEYAPGPQLEPLGREPVIDLSELAAPADLPAVRAATPAAPYRPGQVVRVPIERLDELVRLVSELVIARTTLEQRMVDFGRTSEELRHSADRLRRVSTAMESDYEVSALASDPGGRAVSGSSATAWGFDELELDRYTEFHRLSREMTETTADINSIGNELTTLLGDFDSMLNRQGRLSSELQDKLMRVRMVPLSTLTARLRRAVRVLAREQGKQVELAFEGAEIELDKTVLEEMADPLLHLLRNAVHHGIEPPALRQVMGKPPQGTACLRAFHEGNQVVLQVTDDGAGLEPQLLRSAALTGGFLSTAQAAAASDRDLMALIFQPGFSTAGRITEVSGRGVGLDVVRSQVHKLKGTVAVDSVPGQGTTITVRLPMTLAVARALLVQAHKETFAIPLDAVTQILRLERKELEPLAREQVIRSGGQVFPVLWLGRVLRLRQPADETVKRMPVLILKAEGRQVALVVDHLLGGREIVIKTLGNHLRRVIGITGATLMGDGSVVLILNPGDLVSRPAGPVTEAPAVRQAPRVMIVDDSMSVRRVVSNLIAGAGWQPVAARDGLEALEMVHRGIRPPDAILLDIEMPRMDGYEFMAALRSEAVFQTIPIIILTSRAGEKHRLRALDMGAVDYVVKPYQDQVLIDMIRQRMAEARSEALA